MAPWTIVTFGPDEATRRSIGQALELAVRGGDHVADEELKSAAGATRPTASDADTSVSGAVLVGLLAARNAGIEVPDEAIDKAITYYMQMTSASGQVAYAGGFGGFDESLARSSIATLVYPVARRKDLKQFKATLGYLKQRLETSPAAIWPEYTRYYEAQALFQGDVEAWEKWNKLLVRQLKQAQSTDGSIKGQFGPHDRHVAVAVGAGIELPVSAHLRAMTMLAVRSSTRHLGEHLRDRARRWTTSPMAGVLITLLVRSAAPSAMAEPAPDVPVQTASTARLRDQDFVTGELIDSAAGDHLLWRSPLFASPLRLPLDQVRSVRFPVRGKPEQPQGEYCFELAGGDTLFGALLEISGEQAVIDSPGFGPLHLDRAILRRVHRWNAGDLLYTGPSGLEGWKASGSANAWAKMAGTWWPRRSAP